MIQELKKVVKANWNRFATVIAASILVYAVISLTGIVLFTPLSITKGVFYSVLIVLFLIGIIFCTSLLAATDNNEYPSNVIKGLCIYYIASPLGLVCIVNKLTFFPEIVETKLSPEGVTLLVSGILAMMYSQYCRHKLIQSYN